MPMQFVDEVKKRDAKYIVYKHTTPSHKSYIGITSRDIQTRANYGHGYSTQVFGRAIRKYGWDNIQHDVLETGLTLEQAKRAEIAYIFLFRTTDPRFGYNVSPGGDAGPGVQWTEEQRRQVGARTRRMWEDGEHRERLLQHLHAMNQSRVGGHLSDTHKQAIGAANSIAVDQYTKNGAFIQTFASAMDAARELGVTGNTGIVQCCKGRRKTYYGSIWKYHGDALSTEEVQRRNQCDYHVRAVYMCSDDMTPIQMFPSIHEAGRAIGKSYKGIHDAIQTGRHAYGYRWQYAS